MAKGKTKTKNPDKIASTPEPNVKQSVEKIDDEEIPTVEENIPPYEAPPEDKPEKSETESNEEATADVGSQQEQTEQVATTHSKEEITKVEEEERVEEELQPIDEGEEIPEKQDERKKQKKGGKGKKGKKEVSSPEVSTEKVKKGKKEKKVASVEKGEDELEESAEKKEKETTSVHKEKKKKESSKMKMEEATSAEVIEETPKKKKKSKGSKDVIASDANLETTKKKSKKKKKSGEDITVSDVSLETGKKDKMKKAKGKKIEKTSSAGEKPEGEKVTEQESEGEIKQKKKGKKGKKTPPSSEPSLTTASSKTKSKMMGKTKSTSQASMSRKSEHSYEIVAKRSMIEKSKELALDSSVWTSSESTSESEESEEEKPSPHGPKIASVMFAKGKKGKKGKKEEHRKKKPPSDEEIPQEIEEKKKKKEKKRKKGERQDRAEDEEEILATVDFQNLTEVAKTNYLAELQTTEEETGTVDTATSKKKKKGAKKKLSKKEKARLAAEQAEKARISAEEEAAQAAELERIRLEEERKAAIEKEKRETGEQKIRIEQLEGEMEQFKQLISYNINLRQSAKTKNEWETYVNCGRLPNPSKCDQMNTFLHLWENEIEETSMEEAAKRTKDVLELLNELDDLIDTAENKNSSIVANWKWVRLLFRQQQSKSLDVATYRLLRNIDKNLNRLDIPTADYKYQDENLALCLWLRIQLPTPLPNPRRPPKPRIEVSFPQMKLDVQFPLSLDGEKIAVRALYVKYDHLSDLCDSYDKPSIPEQYNIDLCTAMKMEWREKLLYKYYNRVRKVPHHEGEESQVLPPDNVIGPDEEVPIVPYRKLIPAASDYVITNEDQLYRDIKNNLIITVPDDVINLRRYSIIGGIYSLNLIEQPPQPQDFVTLELHLTPLYLPKQLEFIHLCLDYNPPPPPEPGVRRPPEEIEEEMKRQEEELDKLILVTLTWPDHVIFLELPMVCYWDEERRLWSKSEVQDLKHNEEKGQLTFRTRKPGTFALAVYRYANLPYQAWEMRPEVNGTISLQITAAILMVEFNVKNGFIALSQLQNSPNNALQDIIGMYFPLPKLIRMLQNAGVDVFPAFDAFCYIENTCEKHWPMEKHLYYNMAQMGICFNFAWSRWNMIAGRRSIVLQMREYNLERAKQKNHLMLHVTPLNAIYVDCTEVSQTFSEEGIENMKFYPDLFHLMRGTFPMAVKNKVAKASKELVFALYELLTATRVLSFS